MIAADLSRTRHFQQKQPPLLVLDHRLRTIPPPTMNCSATPRGDSATSVNSDSSHDVELKTKEARPGRTINFAEKLHLVLSNKECRDVVAWLPSGRSFCITNKEKFVQAILPKFFKSKANFNSFERRLKTWGFSKIDASKKVYVFSHDSFRRDVRAEEDLKDDKNAFNLMKQLRIVLSNVDCQSFMWWLPSGESFCVSSTSDLANKILFRYFGDTQFKSFVSALKREGFQRVKTKEVLGEAVYSHEFFQIGRPDLCRLMGRGGIVDLDGTEAQTMCLSANGGLAEASFQPAIRHCSNSVSYPASAAAAAATAPVPTQAFLNPTLNAQRSSMNVNFPIPVNVGYAGHFSGNQAISARIPPPRITADKPFSNEVLLPVNPFAFNGMRQPETIYHNMHMRLNADPNLLFSHAVQRGLTPPEQFLLNQNRNLPLHPGPSSMIHQTQFPVPSQQQIMSNMNSIQEQSLTTLKGIPMLSSQNSLLAANWKLQQHLNEHRKAETDSSMAMLNRHDAAHLQPKMSILEIEEELLKVKEMKFMMMKRKLEEQLDSKVKK
ncbi:hypothetical protein HJC23_011033 [Cyclotella cryptica]|uniref:HSF-type DNA-binding domain-containing protein n=1 Tax=Cyclotella cryptica TaxID=29204 RepID=A0ABD3PFI5_9STRA|eukprot:CCRYP_015217-RA/>CCRYP_015217-RA protein AED:0.03 eAED:0.03 QI:292/1/1/1/1/1/2/274/549